MSKFQFDVILAAHEICNCLSMIKQLKAVVKRGHRAVLYGRRNTGKTSIVTNVIGPWYRKEKPGAMVIYADLYGVRSLDEIANRLRIALQEGFAAAFPKKAALQSAMTFISRLRPSFALDANTGEFGITLDFGATSPQGILKKLLEQIDEYHKKKSVLLIFDEFQDIGLVTGSEAEMRSQLQQMSADLPIIVLGSKKHLLAKIFADPAAPFAGWGVDVEMETICIQEWHAYINERFSSLQRVVPLDCVEAILHFADNIPEPVNIICDRLYRMAESGSPINTDSIAEAVRDIVADRRSRFDERLSRLTAAEEHVLKAIAHKAPVAHPAGKEFFSNIKGVSTRAVTTIVKRFEDDAMIYKTEEGYVIGDPLLALYLKRSR